MPIQVCSAQVVLINLEGTKETKDFDTSAREADSFFQGFTKEKPDYLKSVRLLINGLEVAVC